ncbi:thiamine pyrophosphate-binding protein [bacterium 1XD42-8]|nr:thiamine pyrophosphate-binding protein [bacterium 1XD42-8]
MKKRVADVVMETLIEFGITKCFAVVGGGAMHLNNAMLVCKDMDKYFHHHEQACAMAAEAYAKYSGRMAAVCVTSGPGATNALTGVLGAWQDSLPMIVFSGQVRYEISVQKSGMPLRYRGIQEYEIIPAVKNMTKYAIMLTDPLAVKREIVKAIQIAMDGRRGPVWLDIPQDIQNARVEEEDFYKPEQFSSPIPPVQDIEVKDVLDALQRAKRPCILAGSGIVNSHLREEFSEFVDKMQIPAIGGAWVVDNFYLEHPLYFGSSGNIGPRTGNFILQNADVVLVLGNSLGFRQTGFNQEGFAQRAKVYMVDADPYEAKKPGLKIEKWIYGDLKSFFRSSFTCKLNKEDHEEWITYCNRLKKEFTSFEGAKKAKESERVCMYYFWEMFQKYEPEDSILTLGNNTANSAKMQVGVLKKEQRAMGNYSCGSMGYDLPAAIGAAVASGKRVFCVTGDGSFMMNLQELQTMVHYHLPISIVIFNNEGYGAIRQTSKSFFDGAYIGASPDTGVSFPEFKKIAQAFGFQYLCCETNGHVEEKLKAFFASKERVLLEVMQALDDPVVPKVMSRLDENGKMLTPALQDMYPFLEKNELEKWML